MTQLTTEQLQDKINNGENFILDLFATWCGPCRVMLSNMSKFNEMMIEETGSQPKYNIYTFDIDSDREFSINTLGIRSVPTMKIFKEGEEVFSKVGVMTPYEILNEVKIVL